MGLLTPTGAAALYQIRLDEVDRAVVGESARWGDNHEVTPRTRDVDWIRERDWLLHTYFPQRTEVVLNQFRNRGWYPDVAAPEFRIDGVYQHGGPAAVGSQLSMSAATDTIWYTLDGTDPRSAAHGGIASSGIQYVEPVLLTHSVQVKARAKTASTWSALNEAVYAVGPVADQLRITELMYHPLETGRPDDPNIEFIELTNIGESAIDLSLVRFTNGVEFTFPAYALAPHEYVLVVKDQEAFADRYGDGLPVVGRYAGSLNNGGERVVLEDAVGRVIHDFRYRDNWYGLTDGLGFSLTVVDPLTMDATALSDPSAWRAGMVVGGSPGQDDANHP